MVIRNQIAALIYRILLLAFGCYVLSVAILHDSVISPLNTFRNFASCLTLVSVLAILLEVIVNIISIFTHGNKRMASGIYPAITFVFLSLEIGYMAGHPLYCYLTGAPYMPAGEELLYTLLLSVLFPLGYFLDWLLFGEKGNVKAMHLLEIMALPLLYYLLSLFTHLAHGETFAYATAIFDPRNFLSNSFLPPLFQGNDGWNGVAIASFSLLAIDLCSALIVLFLSYLLAGAILHRPS